MVHKDKDLMLFDRTKYYLKKLRFVDLYGFLYDIGGRCDRIVVGFTTTCAISSYHHQSSNPTHGEVYSLQLYVIEFVSDMPQIGVFCPETLFPPPVKLTTMI